MLHQARPAIPTLASLYAVVLSLLVASCASEPKGPPPYFGDPAVPESDRCSLSIPRVLTVKPFDTEAFDKAAPEGETQQDRAWRRALAIMGAEGSLPRKSSIEPGIHTFLCSYREVVKSGNTETTYSAGPIEVRKVFEAGKSYEFAWRSYYSKGGAWNSDENIVFGVVSAGPSVGCIDASGKTIVDTRHAMYAFAEGLAAYQEGGAWGYMDKAGKTVIAPSYQEAGSFSGGLAQVKIGGAWGYVDKSGVLAIPATYAEVYMFCEGLAIVKGKAGYGFINRVGTMVIAPRFEAAAGFKEGFALVKAGGRWGFIDKTGSYLSQDRYDDAYSFSEGLAAVKVGGKWGYIDASGKMAILPSVYEANSFSEGLALVKISKRDQYGFVDKKGSFVIEPKFDWAASFHEGLAAANIEKVSYIDSGYVDRTGAFVIKPAFKETLAFSEGLAGARAGMYWGFIDKAGRWVIAPEYDWVNTFEGGLARVKK